MKVTVSDEADRTGSAPIIFANASPKQIQDWLWSNYQGYKFAMVFDTTKDEYEELDEARVYFFGDLFDEMVDYIGPKYVERMMDKWKK